MRLRQDVYTDPYERDESFVPTYLDREPFKAYCELVGAVIYTAHERGERPVCTADIHRALGRKAHREWTADALEALCVSTVEEVGVLPVRYRPNLRPSAELLIIHEQRELNTRLFAESYIPVSKEDFYDDDTA